MTHLIDGEFQSDKYPTAPRGTCPLSLNDPTAQDLLWIYAQRRRHLDAAFSSDLETALEHAGFAPVAGGLDHPPDIHQARLALRALYIATEAGVATHMESLLTPLLLELATYREQAHRPRAVTPSPTP